MPLQILSEQTINKIAAGEVVERPANVVKELVENAIDAGSRTIDVEIQEAGRQLIRVRDDGAGMSRDDMHLAVTRHATSKISDFSDLERLGTLGFRGEALPSVAAVSYLHIQSQQRDTAAGGWEMLLAGGALQEDRAWAGSAGTVVEVSRLFYNTPARDKFLKSDATERNRCVAVLEELALAYPGIGFTVTVDGKRVLNAPQTAEPLERLRDVLGKDFVSSLIPVAAAHPSISVSAFVTRREKHLATRNFQFLFINRRPVNLGRVLMHSVYEAYRETLPQGRHPGVVIFIDVNPAQVDVNIHPTKREVKFAHEHEIHDFLMRAVKDAVQSAGPASFIIASPETASVAPGFFQRPTPLAPTVYRQEPWSSASSALVGVQELHALYGKAQDLPGGEEMEDEFGILGQVFGVYIVAEHNNKLMIVDQHAAAERVRYEEYMDEWKKQEIPVQQLLIPMVIELPPSQAGLLRAHLAEIQETGWQMEEFGACTLRISALPAVLGSNVKAQDILEAIVDSLISETRLPPAEKVERIIRAACRGSIKSGDHVSRQEMSRLLRDLFACAAPYTCPHGRPTVFTISHGELAKYFGRT